MAFVASPPSSRGSAGVSRVVGSGSATTITRSSSRPLEDTTVWDVLLDELPPEVELEIDVYWAAVGGRDPAAEIVAHADRVRLLHMKDRGPDPEPRDVPAGEGTLDFPAIVGAGREADVEWYIVEQDEPAAPLDDIARARDYLTTLTVSDATLSGT